MNCTVSVVFGSVIRNCAAYIRNGTFICQILFFTFLCCDLLYVYVGAELNKLLDMGQKTMVDVG